MNQADISSDQFQSSKIILKSTNPKFIKQLNYRENQKIKKQQRKKKQKQKHQNEYSNEIAKQNITKKKLNSQNKKTFREVELNGHRIYGAWDGPFLYDKVEIHYANGSKFIGICKKNVLFEGRFEFSNGFVYEGKFMNDKFFGYGTLKYPDGKSITGEWNGETIQGNAEIKYPQGKIYYGEILNLKKHGFGYLFMDDGSKFIGEFSNGVINGNGSYFMNDELIAQGYWSNGTLAKKIQFNSEQFKYLTLDQDFMENNLKQMMIQSCQRIFSNEKKVNDDVNQRKGLIGTKILTIQDLIPLQNRTNLQIPIGDNILQNTSLR